MKIEDQVVSLELSKRLKELSVEQESLHYWQYVDPYDRYELDNGSFEMQYSAFTVAELGEMLPANVDYQDITYTSETTFLGGLKKWRVRYLDLPRSNRLWSEDADTEADARAKMLIYLIENNLI